MRKVIELPKYDWSIVCFIGYQTPDADEICHALSDIGCIIIDAGLVAMVVAFKASRPFYDYIFFGVLALLVDFLFLAFVGLCFEKPENKCLVIKLPGTVDDDSLPKLK